MDELEALPYVKIIKNDLTRVFFEGDSLFTMIKMEIDCEYTVSMDLTLTGYEIIKNEETALPVFKMKRIQLH